MKLKTFTARSMPDAMQQVRESLGPDAIILSSMTETGDGQVRVTAALEDDPMDAAPVGAGADAPRRIERVQAALRFHRVPDSLIDRLSALAGGLHDDSATMALAAALDAELRFAETTLAETRKPLLLAGPPGAGKSATAAKLCARARMSGLTPALISMDSEKAGGRDQIATFAKAMEASLHQANDAKDLAGAVRAATDADLVIVDTPGLDPFDPRALADIAACAGVAGAEAVLTLPAGLDATESAETAAVFAEIGAVGMIATKLDVTRRFGGILGAAQASGLALIAAGIAPTIADGLRPLNPVALARLLLPQDDKRDAPALATGTLS